MLKLAFLLIRAKVSRYLDVTGEVEFLPSVPHAVCFTYWPGFYVLSKHQ